MISTDNPAALALLRVSARFYGGAVWLRNRFYDRPSAAQPASVPVLSVGNLTVGGTGKTPMVGWLAAQLRSQGLTAAVVSRGYGGRAGRGPLVVSRGRGPLCDADTCGDEPYLLAQSLRDVIVVVGSDRSSGAEAAAQEGADTVVLDDGFQHRGLARDLDIVLLDASNPFGNYRLLPAGLLREPVSGLGRADLVVITRSRPNESFAVIEKAVRHHNPQAPILRAGHRPVGFFDGDGAPVDPPRRAAAFCGIGNPSRFRIDLELGGISIVAFRPFRDHHVYTRGDLDELRSLALAHGVPLVTTQKDLARIGSIKLKRPGLPSIIAMHIEAVVFDPDPLIEAVDRALARRNR